MTKNGQNLNVYGKLKDEERMEAKIPKEGYNPYANNENNNRINLVDYEREEENMNIMHSNLINSMKEDIKEPDN